MIKFSIHLLNISILSFVLLSSCVQPEGEGIVTGQIFIIGCSKVDDYGEKPDVKMPFNLEANFFVGEPILDESIQPDSHRLDVRIQKSSNQIGDVDSLYIQFGKVAKTAKLFSQRKPVPVGIDRNVKASLSLFLTCPDYFDGPTAHKTEAVSSSCPDLSAQEIDQICDNINYGEIANIYDPAPPFQEGHSCIILCNFGNAARGEDVAEDFAVNYGDTISGIFFLSIHSSRIIYDQPEICNDGIDNNENGFIDEDTCTTINAGGFVQGNFKIKLTRAKAIVTFP
ncbi:MAG: hypothetical protein PF689_10095 [Deltaproteobacteria bacterium]|jgi:hypothetical protein|nr:hypothetical protein [Deltaproteobacteria bacterium]